MARTLIQWHNSIDGVPGAPKDQPMYFLITSGLSCDEDKIYFLGLSDAEKIAGSTQAMPATTTAWVLRSCGGMIGIWVEDLDSGSSFFSDDDSSTPTTPDNNVIEAGDRASESESQIFYTNQT